ncbi:hypothetical protein DUNSADRAFT_16259 [Dunaliella salina]|uniref:Guanylate cyclase domain-containing protein n=1 Tax=Dunaliella salina TaxID=3046 RepID=A0ABQ7H165_DUNSA|nr:hypothetical protein DUNSADRAFT_16259 [Dunaliella salina]|eukprot:KAF5840596.1 hypothetical protein DUNSADRAFT_16259 [Dunaliella salina]
MDLFQILQFENLTDNYKVHKVETAGDSYIVSSGVLSDETSNGFSCILDHHDHPEVSASRMMEFAKAVLQEMAKVGFKFKLPFDR